MGVEAAGNRKGGGSVLRDNHCRDGAVRWRCAEWSTAFLVIGRCLEIDRWSAVQTRAFLLESVSVQLLQARFTLYKAMQVSQAARRSVYGFNDVASCVVSECSRRRSTHGPVCGDAA